MPTRLAAETSWIPYSCKKRRAENTGTLNFIRTALTFFKEILLEISGGPFLNLGRGLNNGDDRRRGRLRNCLVWESRHTRGCAGKTVLGLSSCLFFFCFWSSCRCRAVSFASRVEERALLSLGRRQPKRAAFRLCCSSHRALSLCTASFWLVPRPISQLRVLL